MQADELKPCPWCGKEPQYGETMIAKIHYTGPYQGKQTPEIYVHCSIHTVPMPLYKWNTRKE